MPVDFDGEVWVFKTAQSSSIDFNNGVITQAKMTVTLGNIGGEYLLNLFLSANGGVNWESVPNGVSHSFINTGTDLRWKITGSGPFQVNEIKIEDYH